MNADTLITSDGAVLVTIPSQGEAFACAPGETLLMAGLRAGLDLPYECASGSCGSCRCKLVEGEVESLWPEAPGLSERDRRKGNVVLLCQSRPHGNVAVEVRVRGSLVPPSPGRFAARFDHVRPLTHTMFEIVLDLGEPMRFLPGQFVLVDLPGFGRRAYSMANVDRGDGRLVLIVKLVEAGAVSRQICQGLTAGAPVTVEGPYGNAYWRDQGSRPVVAIGGGSGLAPVWSIVQAAARATPRRDVHLYFGVNTARDVCFAGEFAALAREHPHVRVHCAVRGGAVAPCREGLVGDLVIADLPDLTQADVYMAGPPAMIDALMQRLVGEGRVDCDHVFYDRFG